MNGHPRGKVVLGLGNLLLRDEGVGVHVLRELETHYSFGDEVKLVDGGTGGLKLLSYIAEADHLIIIDAIQSGQPPGSLHRLTLDDIAEGTLPLTSLHEVGLSEVLQIACKLGHQPSAVILGVEPQDITSWGTELTPAIAEKVPALINMVLEELERVGVTIRVAK